MMDATRHDGIGQRNFLPAAGLPGRPTVTGAWRGRQFTPLATRVMKNLANALGLELTRLRNSPRHTLLGLRQLPIRTVLDVGANRGQFARSIARIFPEAYIYCFEPLPRPFDALREWAAHLPGRTSLFNLALADTEGSRDIFHHLDHDPSSSFLRSTDACEILYPFTASQVPLAVRVATLDRIVDEFSISLRPEVLIKLDVQGYEDRVIRGAVTTLHHAKACIVEICLDHLYGNQATLKDIVTLLDEVGHRYVGNLEQACARDGHAISIDALFVR